jgi:bacterioferritin-associated ferredoxin
VIVCHCHVVSDGAVREAADLGARTVAENCRATGAGRGCGACVFSIKRVLCQHGQAQVDVTEVEGAAS